MLNVEDKSEFMENVEKIKNIEDESQNQTEFYCWDYNINFFGVGRGAEE
jgi:2-iminoacetate synthase ThiH